MSQKALFNCLQIRNSSLVIYTQSAEPIQRTNKILKTERNLTNTYSGDITKCSKKNISRAINLLIQSSPIKYYINPITNKKNHHQLTFITLTFSTSEIIKLNEGYNLYLKPFLRWMKESKKCKSYVWKAEYQKRGQLHYHITTNEFIRYDEIKSKWNYIQKSNGLLEEYFNKYGNYNPNSTDIHSVYKIKDIESYLIKYVSKSVGESKGKGKVWGCSDNLRGKQYYTISYVPDEIIEGINNYVNDNTLKHLEFIEECSFYKINNQKNFKDILHKSFVDDIKNYINSDYKKCNDYFLNK